MDNKNLTLKWIDTLGNNKIVFERGIIDGTKNRGMEEFRKEQAGVEQKKEKPMSQKMFKVV